MFHDTFFEPNTACQLGKGSGYGTSLTAAQLGIHRGGRALIGSQDLSGDMLTFRLCTSTNEHGTRKKTHHLEEAPFGSLKRVPSFRFLGEYHVLSGSIPQAMTAMARPDLEPKALDASCWFFPPGTPENGAMDILLVSLYQQTGLITLLGAHFGFPFGFPLKPQNTGHAQKKTSHADVASQSISAACIPVKFRPKRATCAFSFHAPVSCGMDAF